MKSQTYQEWKQFSILLQSYVLLFVQSSEFCSDGWSACNDLHMTLFSYHKLCYNIKLTVQTFLSWHYTFLPCSISLAFSWPIRDSYETNQSHSHHVPVTIGLSSFTFITFIFLWTNHKEGTNSQVSWILELLWSIF